eukprot:311954-Amphidinium_carterae.1
MSQSIGLEATSRRHYVIQNFKTEAGAGKDATDALGCLCYRVHGSTCPLLKYFALPEAYIKQQLSGEAGGLRTPKRPNGAA